MAPGSENFSISANLTGGKQVEQGISAIGDAAEKTTRQVDALNASMSKPRAVGMNQAELFPGIEDAFLWLKEEPKAVSALRNTATAMAQVGVATTGTTQQVAHFNDTMLRFAGPDDVEDTFLRFAQGGEVLADLGQTATRTGGRVKQALGEAETGTGKMVRDFALMERAGATGLRSLAGGLGLVATSAAAAGLAIGGVVAAAREVTELGKLGGESLTVKTSFDLMMRSVGVATSELQEMQTAAEGTISTLKLLELANYSVIGVTGQVGQAIGQANDQLITIARAAFKARPSLQSVEFAYQSLVDGIKRVEKRLVDNLGLQVKVREANERYAASVGKSVNELTAEEVQLAFLNEVLRAGNTLVGQVGGTVDTMNDAYSRAAAATTNLKVALGEQLAPATSYAAGVWADFIQRLADSASVLDTTAEWIREINRLKQEQQSGAYGVTPGNERIVEAQRELIRLQEEAAAAGNWEKIVDAMQSVVEWYMKGAEAGTVTAETFVRASDAIAGATSLSKSEIDGLVASLLNGSMSAFEFVNAVDALTQKHQDEQTALSLLRSQLDDYSESMKLYWHEENRIADVVSKARDNAMQSAITSLLKAGMAYGDAEAAATTYADAVADVTEQSERGEVSVAGFAAGMYYASEALDRAAASADGLTWKMRRLFDAMGAVQGYTQEESDLVDEMQEVYDRAAGSAIQSLSAMGASQEAATQAGVAYAKEIQQLEYLLARHVITWEEYNYKVAQADLKLSALKDTYKQTTPEIDKFHETLKGLVESNLSASFTVEGLAPELSVREDEVDEHYRRLAAIAIRGQEEIDKHQADWADTLALIPEDVKAQGIEAMQAWAKDKVLAYDKGLDFSLINRDALKKRIMEALLSQEMKKQLVDEITAELGGAVSEAEVSAAASQVLGGTPLGQITLGGVTFGTSETPPDMSAVAGQISTELNAAFRDKFDATEMLRMTAQAITSADKKPVEEASKVVGTTMVSGIAGAVEKAAPDIVNRLAVAIAPSVARILAEQDRRRGVSQ